MRINHNISSMTTQASLFKTNRDLSKNLEKLSTGLRINRASDDAAGLGVSENLRTQIKGTNQAKRNALDGIAAINIAEGAANEISEILQRMRELAVQSSNDTLTSTERAYTNQEFGHLINEIDRIATVTNYNGQELISSNGGSRFGQKGLSSAATTGSALWIDANNSYGFDSITITIDTLSTEAVTGLGIGTSILSTQTAARAAISALDTAINNVNTMRSNMGAYINRLEHAINNLDVNNTNQQSAESLIRDVDFASETAVFTKNQILTQSATAMLSQANTLPQSVLQLIGGR